MLGAGDDEEEFLDGPADAQPSSHDEHAGHWLMSGQSLTGMRRHRRSIMGQEDSVLLGGPVENVRVIASAKADILRSNNVDVRQAS